MSATICNTPAQEVALNIFNLEIKKKCSLLSICNCVGNNDFTRLYHIDSELGKQLDDLSDDSKTALMSILSGMIGI